MTFAFLQPKSLPEALDMLRAGGPGAMPLAGGTDVGVLLRRLKLKPTHLVSLAGVPDLRSLSQSAGEVIVGSAVTHRQIEDSAIFGGALQALPEACSTVGSVQIRNTGTVGGNLCNASPAADTPPVLLAFGALATVVGPGGMRVVSLDQFFRGYRTTALAPGELLADVRIPVPADRSGSAFLKVGRRKAMEIAIACVGVLVTFAADRQTCLTVRIGLGSVAAVSIRARASEAVLTGQVWTTAGVKVAAEAAAAECAPIDDVRATAEYRRMVVRTLVERALHQAAGRALGPEVSASGGQGHV